MKNLDIILGIALFINIPLQYIGYKRMAGFKHEIAAKVQLLRSMLYIGFVCFIIFRPLSVLSISDQWQGLIGFVLCMSIVFVDLFYLSKFKNQ